MVTVPSVPHVSWYLYLLDAVCAHVQAPQRALVLGVFNGTAYLLKPTDWKGLSHHAYLLLGLARMLQHVAEQFGRDLPDVAYTITSSDVPKVSAPLAPHPAWCLLRSTDVCKGRNKGRKGWEGRLVHGRRMTGLPGGPFPLPPQTHHGWM